MLDCMLKGISHKEKPVSNASITGFNMRACRKIGSPTKALNKNKKY